MNVAERIKELRTAKKYSVNKLANMAGISQSYLREVELGNKNPTVETLSYVCDALEISLNEFFNDPGNDFFNDPLIKSIYNLSPIQRKKLLEFIETIT